MKGQDSSPQRGQTQRTVKNIQVHNVDEPHEVSRQTSTTWTDPTKGQDLSPQNRRTSQGLTI